MTVYALVDPRDGRTRYVGKTMRTVHRRLRRHLVPCMLRGNSYKERWIRQLLSLGMEPTITVLQACTSLADLNDAERFHIARLRGLGAQLTNATAGGDGGSGPHTEESKEKSRRALSGKPKSEEHRKRSGAARRGLRASEQTRAKLRAAHSRPRTPLTDARRVAIARAKGGRPFVDQHGVRYETQKGAARLLGLNVGHLNEVLHGTRSHTGGFAFRFLDSQEFPR